MSVDKLKNGFDATGRESAYSEPLVRSTLPTLPKITDVELEEANSWLLTRGLMWHPAALALSPVARVGLARIASKSGAKARQLLDNAMLDGMPHPITRKPFGIGRTLELLEVLARRNIAIGNYVSQKGILSTGGHWLSGALVEMTHVAELALTEANSGRGISVRLRRHVPWDLIPTSYLNSIKEMFPQVTIWDMGAGPISQITEIDAMVLNDRIVEIKRLMQGSSMDTLDFQSRDEGKLLNPSKLLAIAKKDHLRGVEYALYMEEAGEGWLSSVTELAVVMDVGLRILLYPEGLGSPSVLFDSMEQRQSRGGRILFKIPHLPPLPVKNEGLSVEERAWLAQWIGDPKSRTKAAEKSRHFHHETLPKHASEIASGLLRSLEVHYGPLAIFHVFDGNDAARIIKQADFLVENIGDNPPREILDHLVSVGLEVKDLTEGDEELARTLARLSGFALRDRGALIGLGISRESMKRIEDFIRLSIPSNLRERYLIELPGKRIPALLFNLHRLISERRSELPDELAREIEMVLPERQSELGELRRRFAELALRYRKLPRELQKGQIKTHRQKIPKMIEKAELEGAGDLGMIEIRIEKLELELGIVEDELSADGEETGRRFGGIARSSEESRRGRNADAKANRVKETALIDSEETTSRQNEQAGAESAAANHASSAAVSRSALKAGR